MSLHNLPVRLVLFVIATGLAQAGSGSGTVSKHDVVRQNARIATAVYGDSLETAKMLQTAIDAFIAAPAAASMDVARRAWLQAREPYGQSEVYRFRNGPIDDLADNGGWAEGAGPEGRINAWPLDEALIDYVATRVDGNARNENQPRVSLVQNLIYRFTPQVLAGKNEFNESEANVTSGYHAIEFLLWGQDLNNGETRWNRNSRRDSTPGQRPASDYASNGKCTSGGGNPDDPAICRHRGQYLKAAVELLVQDLGRIVAAWDPDGKDNYYVRFTDPANVDQSLLKILQGMGNLGYGELAGERMLAALAANSQEDEHSCFSDNTHRDIYLNALGIQNTFLGSYTRTDGTVVDGPGIDSLVMDSVPGKRLQAELERTMTMVQRIDASAKAGIPFDRLIEQFPGQDADGRPVQNANRQHNLIVIDAINALQQQTITLQEVIRELVGDVEYPLQDSPAGS